MVKKGRCITHHLWEELGNQIHSFLSTVTVADVAKNNIVSGESAYLSLLSRILESGNDRMDRTGIGTRALFGETMRFDLSK